MYSMHVRAYAHSQRVLYKWCEWVVGACQLFLRLDSLTKRAKINESKAVRSECAYDIVGGGIGMSE